MPHTTINSRRINYVDTGGDGTPVVLVHGFPFNSSMWEGTVAALEGTNRVIVPDLFGFGDSEAVEDRSAYSVDAWADDLAALLDELGVDKVVLGGLSMGGYVVFAFLRKHRARVAGLILADTRAEPDPDAAKEKRTNQQKQVAEEGTAGLIEALTGALLSEDTRSNKPEVVDTAKRHMDNPAPGFIGALEAMKNRPDSTGDLAAIDVPTLVVFGEDDPLMPVEVARDLHEKIDGSRLVLIPKAGHLPHIESPDEFNRAITDFVGSL